MKRAALALKRLLATQLFDAGCLKSHKEGGVVCVQVTYRILSEEFEKDMVKPSDVHICGRRARRATDFSQEAKVWDGLRFSLKNFRVQPRLARSFRLGDVFFWQ